MREFVNIASIYNQYVSEVKGMFSSSLIIKNYFTLMYNLLLYFIYLFLNNNIISRRCNRCYFKKNYHLIKMLKYKVVQV